MTTERSPAKTVWMERAQAGFLRKDAMCVKARGPHALVENKTDTGMKVVCSKCKAGLALKDSKEDIAADKATDIRVACWMCGAPFSSAGRTGDEYVHQMCCHCLVACERAGLLKLKFQNTREIGGRPPMQAHLTE